MNFKFLCFSLLLFSSTFDHAFPHEINTKTDHFNSFLSKLKNNKKRALLASLAVLATAGLCFSLYKNYEQSKENDDLNKQIATLTDQVNTENAQSNNLNEQIADLSKKLESALNDVSSKNDDYCKQIEDLGRKTDALQEEKNETTSKYYDELDKLRSSLQRSDKELKETNNDKVENEKKLKECETKLKAVKLISKELINKIEDLERKIWRITNYDCYFQKTGTSKSTAIENVFKATLLSAKDLVNKSEEIENLIKCKDTEYNAEYRVNARKAYNLVSKSYSSKNPEDCFFKILDQDGKEVYFDSGMSSSRAFYFDENGSQVIYKNIEYFDDNGNKIYYEPELNTFIDDQRCLVNSKNINVITT